MIKVNLTQRIWLAFISLIVLVGLSIIIIYPISIKGTLTEETYRIIENEQLRYAYPLLDLISPRRDEPGFVERREAGSVGHFFIYDTLGRSPEGQPPPTEVLQEMAQNAYNQEASRGRYEIQYGGATVFYVIAKAQISGNPAYHITYMWDTYRDEMVNRLWERLVYILLITSGLSLLPAIWLKHYLRQPLIVLGNHLDQIANRDWKEPLKWKGDEDFQRLSDQFEKMRQNLNLYDHAQKTFIQHASHELKTPIMVIKSYAHSVKDGIMPKENMEKTMDVIVEEANRMERRVIDMLYYTKLDSLKEETPKHEDLVFGDLAFQIEERFRVQREDVKILVEGADTRFKGDREQLEVLLENLVENALRYAQDTIWIKAEADEQRTKIIVENNGEHIPASDLPQLFNPFYKGNKGKFGLGLAIVKRISELHNGYPKVENSDVGVRFVVTIPKQETEQGKAARRHKRKA
ncbi:sensor histidine kinase [Halalkalibacter oceani]|uniref:histidine kinase n=1 Tax=Halalkalibacter oceani TaxID=1653776 RepID=A0A9X2INI2_9BACI|nr:HAMP domain-containing sensor histidine kinase [Halalkalibacter oceani]MCM3712628.1 HAMP domain-containing histidine kinase [Halalkalibacter oceani]MCM3762618.1 HAMP domain-containing histidine kinase [Halalkalibacter oceani]